MSFHDYKWLSKRAGDENESEIVRSYVDHTYADSSWKSWHYFRLRHPIILSLTSAGVLALLLFFTWMGLT